MAEPKYPLMPSFVYGKVSIVNFEKITIWQKAGKYGYGKDSGAGSADH